MALPQRGPLTDRSDVAALREIAGRARPVALAGERVLPVLPALEPLLPDGLRRGSVVAVSGSTSLVLALAAGASAAGSWCAAVGLPSLGLVAAAEVGIALARFPMVASPPAGQFGAVGAALLDALDVVLAWPPPHVRLGDARRLAARARERGSVLVVGSGRVGSGRVDGWSEGVDVRLAVAQSVWAGLGRGHGRLVVRRMEVVATGRRSAARERRAWLWLPAADGGCHPADPSHFPSKNGGHRPHFSTGSS
jgi:hypothetical protein